MATVRIPLSQGKFAIIDEEDFEEVSRHKWHIAGADRNYALSTSKRLRMHRLIVKASPGEIVDHANCDGLDNRRENLRITTHALNIANQRPIRGGVSRYKGVSKLRSDESWYAYITKDKKRTHLGSYNSEEEAAMAYDRAAVVLFGEFSRLNFPDRINEPAPSRITTRGKRRRA